MLFFYSFSHRPRGKGPEKKNNNNKKQLKAYIFPCRPFFTYFIWLIFFRSRRLFSSKLYLLQLIPRGLISTAPRMHLYVGPLLNPVTRLDNIILSASSVSRDWKVNVKEKKKNSGSLFFFYIFCNFFTQWVNGIHGVKKRSKAIFRAASFKKL